MVEVGSFIECKNFLMAVVAINEPKGKGYALCYENHLLATFPLHDKDVKVVKQEGSPRLIRGIYDLMKQYKTLEAVDKE